MIDKSKLLEEIKKIVGNHLGVSNVEKDSLFMEDLGAESVDIVLLINSAEDKYNICFNEADIPDIFSVKDLFEYTYKLLQNKKIAE